MRWREYRNKILSAVDAEAFYVDELKKRDLVYARHGMELKSQCPFKDKHLSGQDTNPSFTVNLSSGVYFCNACGSKGNIHTFIVETQHLSKQDAWYVLGDALGLERPAEEDTRPMIDTGLPARYHKQLMESTGVIRDVLKERRGLTNDTLVRFQIGWDGERITIPVYDEYSELVNIRRYKWNSYEDNTKMINYTDAVGNTYGEATIYGVEHLVEPTVEGVVWCEGEWDRVILEQNGIKACTATAGANNLRNEWVRLLSRKRRVYICYDNDKAGREATTKLVDSLRGLTEVYVMRWPEGWRAKGDPTDAFVKDKWTAEQFMSYFIPLENYETVPTVSLSASSNAKYTGKRIKVPVLLAGKDTSPYVYPKTIRITCEDADEEKKLCNSCILLYKKKVELTINSNNPLMLKVINVSDEVQRAIIKGCVGCNAKCPLADYNIVEYGNLEGVYMVPKADVSTGVAKHQEYVARTGYALGNGIPTNKRYNMVGYMHADPNNQKATYIFDEALPEKDLLDDLEMTEEVIDKLRTFQPAEGQTVKEKFNEIHADLERNVTYIWERRAVAVAVDLVYHSALSFVFQEQPVKRGWAECLIIGDSGQAKTTLVERLMQHYQCGDLISGESAKRTGLVYNLQQTAGKGNWTLVWGAMPLNDGGLLTIDELSGMPEDDLAKMSDVRSSGIAKATGVVTGETTARTRMIFISNPRNGRQLKAENYGVAAILKLFGKAEDVRRLDFAIGVASGEVDSDMVNKAVSEMPTVPHIYTSELCRLCVQWAWSRKPENIQFTSDAVTAILKHATLMGRKFSSRIPIVEAADQRLKLARLSVAAAARLFSTDDGTNVIVKAEHVEFVAEYLNNIYASKALGYDRFSADEFENSDTSDATMGRLRNLFASIPLVSYGPNEVAKVLYQMPYFNRNTLEDATGLDRDELKSVMQFLISNSLIEKAGMDYRRTPLGLAFIEACLTQPITDDEMRTARQRRFSHNEI